MKLYYRGILDKDHSWGVVATELCLALERQGFSLAMSDPIHKENFDAGRVDPRLKDKLSSDTTNDTILSYCVPPNLKALPKGPIANIYNYEYSQIPAGWAQLINNQVNLFLPSSEFAKDVFIKNGVRPEITEVLPHGIDLKKYNPQIPPYNFNSNKFIFLCVSSPHYRKGLDILLRAFGEEFATIEEVELVIKTQIPKKRAPYELDIRKLLDEIRKTVALPRVRVITDYFPTLAPLYRAAHAYVSANHSECFGLTELEAVCCGLPTIVTNYGGYLDFLNQENSYLIKQKPMYASREMQYWHYHPRSVCADPDRQHLRQLMRYVFNNYKQAQQKAKLAYEQVVPNYTWDKVAETFIRLADQHKLFSRTQLRVQSERKVPVGILVPEGTPAPNRDLQGAQDSAVEALRRSLQKKAKQTAAVASPELQNNVANNSIKATISTHTIVYNEEHNIEGLLDNLSSSFDEIVIVDGGSTDGTVSKIRAYIETNAANHIKLFIKPQKDKVRYSNKWNQSEQRNFAILQCTSTWVFMIDADERLDSEFKKHLYELASGERVKAFAFPKHHYWESDAQIRIDSWWYPNYSYRLWRRDAGIRYENKARHCQPIVAHLGLPSVLVEKKVQNFGPYSDRPIHHLHYLTHTPNELGLYRANEKDVRSIAEVRKGLKLKAVTPLSQVLNRTLEASTLDIRTEEDRKGLIDGAHNVAFVMENFTFYSGGRYHLYQEAFALAKAGANVWLITNTIPVYVNDFPKLENFRVVDGWVTPRNIRFDIVVGTPSNCGERAKQLAKQHGAKLILVSLETPNFIREYRDGKDASEEYWASYKAVLPAADYVLASAKLPATYLQKWVGIPDEKIVLMPPAVNEYAFKRVGDVKKSNTLVFVSRIVEHKKLDNLLGAVARVQKSMNDPPVVDIIGNGSAERVQKLLLSTGAKGRFFTNISDVAKFQLIKRSKGLITCSTYEGFGMSPLEGMLCEVPVLCSDLPIFHETLGNRVTYYPIDDTTALTNYIKAALSNSNIYSAKIADAKKWVEEQYTIGAMIRRWKDLLKKIAKTAAPIQVVEPQAVTKVAESTSLPKVSVCIIALNEAEYITYTLQQIYNWDCCHEIIVVEGSVGLYPKKNLAVNGLSGDGTTDLIKGFPDPEGKIKYVSGTYKDKIEQRNEYAKRVTGTHVLVLDADEFYSSQSLELLKQDIIANPKAELFTFNFSQDVSERTYYHLWYNFKQHVVGGYWDIPHNRIYKWTPGTQYTGTDHNHPTKPDGTKLLKEKVHSVNTRAVCIHTGFVKSIVNQKDKNDFYVNRGEGKESDPQLRQRRQMYIDCRRAYETWTSKAVLPHKARVLPFEHLLPESLLEHPYMRDPNILLKQRGVK